MVEEVKWWEGFYKKPLLWALAWIPILAMWLSVVIWRPIVTVMGGPSYTWSEAQELLSGSGHSMGLAGVGMHLCPFGFEFSTQAGWMGSVIIIIKGSILPGLVLLLLGLAVVGMITKDSDDTVYVIGPFWVYSLLAIVWMSMITSSNAQAPAHFTGAGSLVWQSLVYSVILGVVAKVLLKLATNYNLIEMDGAWTESGGDIFNTPPGEASQHAAIHAAILGVSRVKLASGGVIISADGTSVPEPEPERPSLFHEEDILPVMTAEEKIHRDVQKANIPMWPPLMYVCPICRHPLKQFRRPTGGKPWVCPNPGCRQNLAAYSESTKDSCSSCQRPLLNTPIARFCHYCGWQIGLEVPVLPNGGVGL